MKTTFPKPKATPIKTKGTMQPKTVAKRKKMSKGKATNL